MIKAVLFDLDGTLLPMNQNQFIKLYFGTLAEKMAKKGIDPQHLIASIAKGTESMIKNDGSMLNEERFWQVFEEEMQMNPKLLEKDFLDFYRNEFAVAKQACGLNPNSKEVVELLKKKGYRLICATNPMFPAVATQNRIRWAGLDVEDFEHITTFEKCSYCKPNLKYYEEILAHAQLQPKEVIMVGNDVQEDMIAAKLGIKVHLITDDLINKTDEKVACQFQGSMQEFKDYIIENY